MKLTPANRIGIPLTHLELGPRIRLRLTLNWTGTPRSPRRFALQALLRSRALSHQMDYLTASRSYQVCQLSSCRSPSNLCHYIATKSGQQIKSYPHRSFHRFGAMSSISIPNQAAGPVRRSITFTIQCRGLSLTTSRLISALAAYAVTGYRLLKTIWF